MRQVTHAMFDPVSGVLPCCGLHRYEVVQTDTVSVLPDQPVTCDGTKRYGGRRAGQAAGEA